MGIGVLTLAIVAGVMPPKISWTLTLQCLPLMREEVDRRRQVEFYITDPLKVLYQVNVIEHKT